MIDESKRQTGRTTRAIKELDKYGGKKIYIYPHLMMAMSAQKYFADIINKESIEFTSVEKFSKDIRGKSFEFEAIGIDHTVFEFGFKIQSMITFLQTIAAVKTKIIV